MSKVHISSDNYPARQWRLQRLCRHVETNFNRPNEPDGSGDGASRDRSRTSSVLRQ